MPRHRTALTCTAPLVLALALAACDVPTADEAEPPPSSSAALTPDPEVQPEAAPPPNPDKPWHGWWRSERACLELFENGDFELTDQGNRGGPKSMVIGRASLAHASASKAKLTIHVDRIWNARFTGPCRKVHEFGGWVEDKSLLGVDMAPESDAEWTLALKSETSLELCGTACLTLTREDRHLGARWRKSREEFAQLEGEAGELLELGLEEDLAFVKVGGKDRKPIRADGRAEVSYLNGDRFEVRFKPRVMGPSGHAPPAQLNGASIRDGKLRTFTAQRLAGERLELCEDATCVVLERLFDGSRHTLH